MEDCCVQRSGLVNDSFQTTQRRFLLSLANAEFQSGWNVNKTDDTVCREVHIASDVLCGRMHEPGICPVALGYIQETRNSGDENGSEEKSDSKK